MTDEIDDFLRKAAERRKQRKNKKTAPPPPATTTRTPLQPLPSQAPATPSISRPLSQRSELQERHAIDQSVHQHIDTSEFTSRAHEQGFDDLEIVDEQVDGRLHDKFDHSVGSLRETQQEPQPRRTSSPSVIAGLFSNPQNIRQAFIMSEIMKPLGLRDDEPKRS